MDTTSLPKMVQEQTHTLTWQPSPALRQLHRPSTGISPWEHNYQTFLTICGRAYLDHFYDLDVADEE